MKKLLAFIIRLARDAEDTGQGDRLHWRALPKENKILSQLQNSPGCKNVLLRPVVPAPPRLPSWAGRRRRGAGRQRLPSQLATKT